MSAVSHDTLEDEKSEENEWVWETGGEEEERFVYQPFFDSTRYETPLEALEQDTRVTKGEFDLLDLIRHLDLDSYGVIRVVNYLRGLKGDAEAGVVFSKELRMQGKGHGVWEDEAYLFPVDPQDPFLCVDFHGLIEDESAGHSVEGESQKRLSEVEYLQLENMKLRQELEWLKLGSEGREGIQSVLETERNGGTSGRSELPEVSGCPSDSAYFQSYSTEWIHREMLSDKAIEGNRHLLEGKTVLDVGCGTGILSLMACRVGAKHVYAVDASPWAASMTEKIVEENGFQERMTVIRSKVEDIQEEMEPVDVIVSEWMGYALLFESMLDSVLHAKNRWLSPGGIIMPDKARLFIAGASEDALNTTFWKDVYGFSMTSVAEEIAQRAQKIPLVHCVPVEHLLTDAYVIQEFDIQNLDPGETDFSSEFRLVPSSTEEEPKKISALVIWFEVDFTHANETLTITTSPDNSPTHWAQTVLGLKQPMCGGLHGSISFALDTSSRSLLISLHCPSISGDNQTMLYTMDVLS